MLFTMIGLVAVEKVKEEMKNRSSWFTCRFNLHKVAKKENFCFNIFIIMSLERAPQHVYQTAALPRHQEEEETDKSKEAQIEQTYEKH